MSKKLQFFGHSVNKNENNMLLEKKNLENTIVKFSKEKARLDAHVKELNKIIEVLD